LNDYFFYCCAIWINDSVINADTTASTTTNTASDSSITPKKLGFILILLLINWSKISN